LPAIALATAGVTLRLMLLPLLQEQLFTGIATSLSPDSMLLAMTGWAGFRLITPRA